MCIVPVQLPQLHTVLNDFSAGIPGASAVTVALGVLQQIVALLAGKLVTLLNIPIKILCDFIYALIHPHQPLIQSGQMWLHVVAYLEKIQFKAI